MAKIKTIIVDDEPKAIDIIARYCQETDSIELGPTFRDPIKALSYLKEHPVDLIFLDINMPKISGMELMDVLIKKSKVIFTTAYSEFAVESYEYEAVDYLLKPVSLPRFLKAIEKVTRNDDNPLAEIEYHSSQEKILYVKSGPKMHRVNERDILYLEKDGNYLIFHTKTKNILARRNMKDAMDSLDSNQFIRIHKSYIIAKRHVVIIKAYQVQIGDKKIPIGRNYRSEVEKHFTND